MRVTVEGDVRWKQLQRDSKTMMLGLEKSVAEEIRERIKARVLEPIMDDMRAGAAAIGRQQIRGAMSLKAAGGVRPGITLGAGRTRNARLAIGSEFGAIPAKRARNYTGRNRHGRFKATRRSTRQFPRSNDGGYYATPAWNRRMEWAIGELADIVESELRRQLHA